MSELRTGLERLGERARARPDAFERLARRRRQRGRNRRVAAGVVALAVALGGTFVAFTALRGGEGARLGGGDGGFFSLWPQETRPQALAVQERVEAGDPDVKWRLNARQTAARFATDALGWEGVDIPGEVAGPGPVDVSIVEVGREGAGGSGEGDATAVVTMDRLVSSTGAWSVIAVRSPELELPLTPGQEIQLDAPLEIPTGLEDGTEVAVGAAATRSCSGFHEETALVEEGSVTLRPRGIADGCAGYVYTLAPSTPVGQVETGRIMFVREKPALDYTIDSIAAVPVRFTAGEAPSPSGAELAGALHVTCGRETIRVEPPVVAAQPEGVHVVFENASDEALFFNFANEERGFNGIQAEPGTIELSVQFGPGAVILKCVAEPDRVASNEVEIEVLDPQGLFVPFDLACLRLPPPSPGPWPAGEPTRAPDPVEHVRSVAGGLRSSDVLERAGYPEAPNPVVRTVRDGEVIATFDLTLRGGRWETGFVGCEGSGITLPEEPGPYPRGAFEWCPDLEGPEPGRDWRSQGSETAIRFVEAYVAGDREALAEVLDPSVPPGAEFPVELAEGTEPRVIGTNAQGGEIVHFACGNDVNAYTVAITIDDGTESASLDFTVYLVLQDDGWKVWNVH